MKTAIRPWLSAAAASCRSRDVLRRAGVHAGQVHHAVDAPFVHQPHRARDAVGRDVRVDVDAVIAAVAVEPARRGDAGAASAAGGLADGRAAPAGARASARRAPASATGRDARASRVARVDFFDVRPAGVLGRARRSLSASPPPGGGAIRRSLTLTLRPGGVLPCARDQSLAPTIRSWVSNPSFFNVMAWGEPGSMSRLVNGVIPTGLPSIDTSAPGGRRGDLQDRGGGFGLRRGRGGLGRRAVCRRPAFPRRVWPRRVSPRRASRRRAALAGRRVPDEASSCALCREPRRDEARSSAAGFSAAGFSAAGAAATARRPARGRRVRGVGGGARWRVGAVAGGASGAIVAADVVTG